MHRITFPLPVFRHCLHTLQQRPSSPLRHPIGVSRWARHIELLATAPASEAGHSLYMSWTDTFAMPHSLPPDCMGVLLLGRNQHRGRALGAVRFPAQDLTPVHALRLAGPGMLTINLQRGPRAEWSSQVGKESTQDSLERWSRTIGALGLEVWQRLRGLRYAIVGLGRTGSSLALARLGVRHLTLIDPDRLELHNLGEMLGASAADLGRYKVEAVASALTSTASPQLNIVTVPASITRWPALYAVQACDVLLSCVDHDSARLAATAVATVCCKPLLDIATGVHGSELDREMGADVRLVLPGNCLLCCGGLRDHTHALQVLAQPEAERAFSAQRDWRRERAGSLASLNHCAVGVALRLLEDFVAARIQDSTWVHLAFSPEDSLSVTYPPVSPPQPPVRCRLCRLTGWGDAGVPRLVDLWQAESPLGATESA